MMTKMIQIAIYHLKTKNKLLILLNINKMDTPTMKQKIKNLSDKLGNITNKHKPIFNFNTLKSISPVAICVMFSVFILIILLAFRPEFLYNYSNDHRTKIFSYNKLFVWWLSLTFVFLIIFYLYKHQEKK